MRNGARHTYKLKKEGGKELPRMLLTFNNDNTRCFILAQMVAGHTFVFPRIFGFAIDNLHGDHTISLAHGIVELRQLLSALVPLNSWDRLARQTAEQFASLVTLNDTRTEEEGEAGGTLTFLLPQLVRQRLSAPYNLFLWFVCWHFRW